MVCTVCMLNYPGLTGVFVLLFSAQSAAAEEVNTAVNDHLKE